MSKFDIYIAIPVNVEKNIIQMEHKDSFIEKMNNLCEYECRKKISKSLKRTKLDNVLFACYADDNYNDKPYKYLDCEVSFTYQEKSKLGLIMLMLKDFDGDPTMIGDMVSSKEHFQFKENDEIINVREWLKKYNLFSCGKTRVIFLSERKAVNNITLKSLLAGQVEKSKMLGEDVVFSDNFYNEYVSTNHGKYNFYDLYISERNIVMLCDNYGKNKINDIEKVALVIFICEIAIMQNAAISRINDKIVSELTQNSNISSNKILKMLVEFGKTIVLWDNNIYNYSAPQEISNDMVKAFKTNELLEEYNKNSKHLSQIANIKSDIASNIGNGILDLLALILALNELTTIIPNFINFISGRKVEVIEVGSGIVVLIIIFIIVRRKYKK